MIDPQEITEARRALGAQLAALREAAGYTQWQLAPQMLHSRSTIANVETGHQPGTRDFWDSADRILHADGVLLRGYEQVQALIRRQREDVVVTRMAARKTVDLAAQAPTAVTSLPSHRVAEYRPPERDMVSLLTPRHPDAETWSQRQLHLWAPQGRFFPGLDIQAQVHPAVDDGRVLAAVPVGYGEDPFLNQPGRGLVIGQTDNAGRAQMFGLDSRHARRRIRRAPESARLLIPRAYRLDELTFAVLWALANLDEGLLADDALLEQCRNDLAGYEPLDTSAGSRDIAADLTVAAQMWLGSAFCAGHIQRHAGTLTDVPVFWTREQRGEEASTWLLFAHKTQYLRVTTARLASTGNPMVRAFCVPRPAVEPSPRGERILLLLAVALIESYGIAVVVTDEPEYAGIAGFVSDRHRRAIVANWVGADGIWHVDVTDHRPTLREYADAADHASAHSVIAASTSRGRLHALAEYLELDWPWLVGRCRELGERGWAGLAQPRSRHLSVAGVDRACRYLAGLGVETD